MNADSSSALLTVRDRGDVVYATTPAPAFTTPPTPLRMTPPTLESADVKLRVEALRGVDNGLGPGLDDGDTLAVSMRGRDGVAFLCDDALTVRTLLAIGSSSSLDPEAVDAGSVASASAAAEVVCPIRCRGCFLCHLPHPPSPPPALPPLIAPIHGCPNPSFPPVQVTSKGSLIPR